MTLGAPLGVFLSAALLTTMTACNDWLEETSPGKTKLEDYFTSGEAAVQNVTADYAPLSWEFNNTYYSEWFIGDICSDDALKGGQNTNDMADAYDMENWKTQTNNGLLLDYFRAQYQGVARCNQTLKYVAEMPTDETLTLPLRNRVLAEAHFLRLLLLPPRPRVRRRASGGLRCGGRRPMAPAPCKQRGCL